MPSEQDRIVGCLLGTAVGDALGLPFEGLSKRRICKFHPDLNRYHFFFGRGMTSDDTEHTCMVAQALILSGGDVKRFENPRVNENHSHGSEGGVRSGIIGARTGKAGIPPAL